MNRYQLESMRAGMAQELKSATEKLSALYADVSTNMDVRKTQQHAVEDMKERLEGINRQIQEMDAQAEAKLKKVSTESDAADVKKAARAELYRATMQNRPMEDRYKALLDTPSSGGDKFLPKTVASEIIAEPTVKNPLRGVSTMTGIPNLEIPKISFSLDDDDFITDETTAKEIKATGGVVSFERKKFKVYVDISETVISGTDTSLISVVEAGLESGLARKEKKVAFAAAPKSGEEHMSFYNRTDGVYDIKATECAAGTSLYHAIREAIGSLGEDYRENAKVCMTYADYLSIIENLANGSAAMYGVQPEQILGKPVIFCDMAVIPIVGDFSYSHFNYDIGMLYDHDKNIKTGMESFVLTAWFDHRIKLKSAFRLATIREGASS